MRVLLVHDHRMLTELLVPVLHAHDGIEVCAVEQTVSGALGAARREQPDVVVLDYLLPDGDGVDLAAGLHREDHPPKLVVLTCSQDESTLRQIVEAGCSGVVTKDHAVDELVRAIRIVHAGGAAFSPDLLERVLHEHRDGARSAPAVLSARELEILRLMADGWSNRDAAERLTISYNTMRNHVQRIITKLGVHSKLEAVAAASRLGLVRRRPRKR